jgi:hypothetical protein
MIHIVPLVFAFLFYLSRNMHFECPNCGCRFKVSGLLFAITPHVGPNRYVTCPNCKFSGMMPAVLDNK